ncbi:MarR family winged helix-turn-helix transcriptional regulator [Mucilaginibacter sp. SP1R1]|uniref:MarR family winged helix-turn-helix transcriptional regulator n=1 Tax=Mucilaginibacter sp. SP1R1 TaxID=2723091 RepID=UPI001615610F|nr:MarR family winged helix-turn-helix transcriptional regulator [Mucilaginibacter sp. SP1R1]MBB6150168.1 DNA-binding MarR family transcriptional regulator [Mucilaginibacter sp. SP1R1]
MKQTDNTFNFDNAEDSSGFLLWQVTNLWQREIKKALEQYDLTHSQYVLLASTHWLTLHHKDVTQVLLSTHTKIDPMTTSTVLRTLQAKGLLKRQEHAIDTRAKTVMLTDEGKQIIKQAVITVEDFDQNFFSALGTDASAFNKKLTGLLSYKG